MQHLLGLWDLQRSEIETLLTTARSMREVLGRPIKKVPTLRGRLVVTLFVEPSTRTRVSFEVAARTLSADVAGLSPRGSSMEKGETLLDTIEVLRAMGAAAVVVRHPVAGVPQRLAQLGKLAVLNAGDGLHEHPTQGLLDAFTVLDKKGRVEGLRVAIVGDIWHSRVARSDMLAFRKLGASVVVAGPPTLIPPGLDRFDVEVVTSVEEALREADVVQVLRIQKERQDRGYLPSLKEYHRFYGVTEQRLALAKPDVLLMHPLPANRGVEVSSAVLDGPHSVVWAQVENGIAVRMAVLYHLLGSRREEGSGDAHAL